MLKHAFVNMEHLIQFPAWKLPMMTKQGFETVPGQNHLPSAGCIAATCQDSLDSTFQIHDLYQPHGQG